MSDRASSEPDPRTVTVEQVHTEFAKLLRDRKHMGVRNFLGDAVFEPRNPFQCTRRSPKKWAFAIVGILLLGVLILYWFHVR